ncbi:cytochrome P450 [Streptomyces sp. NPDC101455]|uniref:cytochrome P450 n=1 Tax=Streptomyces sp. NPDC101455 TaxID=3366142 RepID=UPI00380F4983
MSIAASSAVDLFEDNRLIDPYPTYRSLRDTGPVVRLERHGVWAVPRFAEVHAVLQNDAVFRSEGGVALTDVANSGLLSGTALASDGDQHTLLRRVLSQQLAPRAITKLRKQITDRAHALVEQHVAHGTFDAVALAEAMVGNTVMDLMGLPESTRLTLLTEAKAAFDVVGPDNHRYQQALPRAEAMTALLYTIVTRESVRQDAWISDIYRAVDESQLDEAQAPRLAVEYTTAGMDTTILGATEAIVQLARHPAQWALLREDPGRASSAFHEALRLEAPIQGFGRFVHEDTDLGGVRIEAGEQVWLLFGSAGRDRDQWGPTADTYNLRRRLPSRHLSLGGGRHVCAGSHLAEMQVIALLRALATHCTRLTLSAEPERVLNNVLRGYKQALVTVQFAPGNSGEREE